MIANDSECDSSFAIIIPAHNEETTIKKTIDSCLALDYQKAKKSIFVVADNCTDGTACEAIDSGATCLIRTNTINRGKGCALAWAFDQITLSDYTAVLIIDADCIIDEDALKIFDLYLTSGELALQANDVASNPDESPMSYAVSVGNYIENELFYYPKELLGLAVQLRGTGMVFSTQIFKQFPWSADSNVEDMEYSLELFKNGISIRFVRETKVSSDFPATKEQLEVQRARWAGNIGLGKSQAIKLIYQGLLKGPKILIDVGWNFLALSRPLVLLGTFISLLFSIVCQVFVPGDVSAYLLFLAIVTLLVQFFYHGLGIIMLGLSKHRISLLFSVPTIVLKLIIISIGGLLGSNSELWKRTPRNKNNRNGS